MFCVKLGTLKKAVACSRKYIYIYIYRQVSSLESYMSRVLNTVVELIRLEDKLDLLYMNFISLQICFV